MIEDVEELAAKLGRPALGDLEIFRQSEVHIFPRGTAQDGPRRIPERIWRGALEGCRVEPVVKGLLSGIGIADLIGPRGSSRERIGIVDGIEDCEGLAGLENAEDADL